MHAHTGQPPFLVMFADNDLPYCGKPDADDFVKVLKEKKCPVRELEAEKRTHMSMLLAAATVDDPVNRAIMEFVGAAK